MSAARRSTYSRTNDPETGVPVHSLNFTTLQVAIGFLIQFVTLCTMVFGVLWVFAEPRVLETVKRHNGETVVPRIVALEAAAPTYMTRNESAEITERRDRERAELLAELRYIREKLDKLYERGR